MGIPNLRTCHLEAREDIMTKFKSQALHIKRIKYRKASGMATLPPSYLPSGKLLFMYETEIFYTILHTTV